MGCAYVIHVANPVDGPSNVPAAEFITPVAEGMRAIIEGAVASRTKRIVVTSSFATVIGVAFKKDTGETLYSEKDFTPAEGTSPYCQGKIAQEKVIFDFLKNQEQENPDHKVEIVITLPTLVIGPCLINSPNSSAEGIAKFMRRDIPVVPPLMMPCVDVRDVAVAHLLALE